MREFEDATGLLVETECVYYIPSTTNKIICNNLKVNKICPFRHIEDINCNAKGLIRMDSLYYLIYKNKYNKKETC